MKVLTLLMSIKIKKSLNDATWVSNACRAINEMINEWMEKDMVIDVVNEKEKVTTRYQNWAFRVKVVGTNDKNKNSLFQWKQ